MSTLKKISFPINYSFDLLIITIKAVDLQCIRNSNLTNDYETAFNEMYFLINKKKTLNRCIVFIHWLTSNEISILRLFET